MQMHKRRALFRCPRPRNSQGSLVLALLVVFFCNGEKIFQCTAATHSSQAARGFGYDPSKSSFSETSSSANAPTILPIPTSSCGKSVGPKTRSHTRNPQPSSPGCPKCQGEKAAGVDHSSGTVVKEDETLTVEPACFYACSAEDYIRIKQVHYAFSRRRGERHRSATPPETEMEFLESFLHQERKH